MPRTKKDARVLNIKLEKQVYDTLSKFTAETGIPKTTVVEKVLSGFFEEYYEKPEEQRKIFD